jgi:hypothetical protein
MVNEANGLTAQIEALLRLPASPERAGKLHALGVALFGAIRAGSEPESAYAVMARALQAAADGGHALAWVDVGRCRWNGWGVPVDREGALQAYARAAALGGEYGACAAAFNLYRSREHDAEAYVYVQRALAGKDPAGEAHYLAGLMAHDGRGRSKDEAEALRLYGEAARRGHAGAAECLRRAATRSARRRRSAQNV